jgi:PAS domain S-box-containing protein
MHSSIILSKTFKYIVGEDFCYKEEGVAVITVSRVSLGVIDYCNRYMASIFGYTQRDLNKARINILMPETINRVHDGFLQEFLENPGKQKQDCTSWELMGKQKNGYLFPIVMELKKSVVAGEIKFMAIINRRKKAIN